MGTPPSNLADDPLGASQYDSMKIANTKRFFVNQNIWSKDKPCEARAAVSVGLYRCQRALSSVNWSNMGTKAGYVKWVMPVADLGYNNFMQTKYYISMNFTFELINFQQKCTYVLFHPNRTHGRPVDGVKLSILVEVVHALLVLLLAAKLGSPNVKPLERPKHKQQCTTGQRTGRDPPCAHVAQGSLSST
jgi:hypothetical protein